MAVVVPLDGERKSAPISDRMPKPSLDAITNLVADDLKEVNALILRRMDSSVPLIPQLAGHIIAAGGKRLRPILTLAAAKLCGYRGTRQIGLAACIEFIHTATLLHDDVVDDSDLRRGRDTANSLWGNKASVLVGDFLFSRAFQMMVEDGSLPVLAILSRASAMIAEGEVRSCSPRTIFRPARWPISKWSRARPRRCSRRRARSARKWPARRRPKKKRSIVTASISASPSSSSTTRSTMPRRAKPWARPWATISATARSRCRSSSPFAAATEFEREFWRRTLEELDQKDGDLDHAIALMQRHRALEDTIERARHYGAIARDALGIFPDSAAKKRAARSDRFRHRAGLLSALASRGRLVYTRRFPPECSSAW